MGTKLCQMGMNEGQRGGRVGRVWAGVPQIFLGRSSVDFLSGEMLRQLRGENSARYRNRGPVFQWVDPRRRPPCKTVRIQSRKVHKYPVYHSTTGWVSGWGNLDLFFFPLARGQQTVTRDQGGREVERNQTRVERRADVRMWTGGPRSGYASCESMLDGGGGDEQGEAQLMKLISKSARRKAEDERMKMTSVSRQ